MLSTTEEFMRYELPWEVLRALLEGVSSLDLEQFSISGREDAGQFLSNYGYDWEDSQDRNELIGFFHEAIRFLETHFLDPAEPGLRIPDEIKQNDDLLDLIVLGALGDRPNRYWACAILKLIHTITHIHHGPLFHYFDIARKQVLSRFQDILTPLDENGSTYILGKLGGPTLSLYGFETKDEKSRDSILIKLLSKKEHVAEFIWDLLGVRLITHTPGEAILALHILHRYKIMVFPNIIPSRSRNYLIDFDRFQKEYMTEFTRIIEPFVSKAIDENDALDQELKNLFSTIDCAPPPEPEDRLHNPSSSQKYRSIHVTSRQLIRIPNGNNAPERRFFFPFEIQIIDKSNYLESKQGESAHNIYKRKQLAIARKRVLGPLINAEILQNS